MSDSRRELYPGDAQLSEITDQVTPRIVQLPDRGDKRDDTTDRELIGLHQPNANKRRRHNLQVVAQIHLKIH